MPDHYTSEESALLEQLISSEDDVDEDVPPPPKLVIPSKQELKILSSPDNSEKVLKKGKGKRRKRKPNNIHVLVVTALVFGCFVVAEIIGALASHSLSLLGDGAAMSVDVFTYFSNMYAEVVKSRSPDGQLDAGTRRMLEVYIPTLSILALLGVTGYITSDAVTVILQGPDEGEEVDVYFLFAFASANFCVDIISAWMFYWRGKDVLITSPISHERQSIDFPHDNGCLCPGDPGYEEAKERKKHGKEHVHPTTQYLQGVVNGDSPNTPNQAPNTGSSNKNKPFFKRPNLNMISALTHVGSDTMRTTSVFVAALISFLANQNSSLCDAWAAIVVSITILFAVIPLVTEICRAAKHMNCTGDDDCSCICGDEEDEEEGDISAVIDVHDDEAGQEEDVHNALLGDGPILGQLEESMSSRISGNSGRVVTD